MISICGRRIWCDDCLEGIRRANIVLSIKVMVGIYIILSVLPFAELSSGVLIGAGCHDTYECSVVNSVCIRPYGMCSDGVCKCKEGYQPRDTTVCNGRKFIDDVCTYNDVCLGGTECVGTPTQCKCPTGASFDHALQHCLFNNMTALGRACTNNVQCSAVNSEPNSVQCEPLEGTSDPKYCRCKPGYMQHGFKCRLPQLGELCNEAVGCHQTLMNGDNSVVRSICSNGRCMCGLSDRITMTYIDNVPQFVCMQTFSGDLLSEAVRCTNANQCKTKTCHSCPGPDQKICVHAKSSTGDWPSGDILITTLVSLFAVVCY